MGKIICFLLQVENSKKNYAWEKAKGAILSVSQMQILKYCHIFGGFWS